MYIINCFATSSLFNLSSLFSKSNLLQSSSLTFFNFLRDGEFSVLFPTANSRNWPENSINGSIGIVGM